MPIHRSPFLPVIVALKLGLIWHLSTSRPAAAGETGSIGDRIAALEQQHVTQKRDKLSVTVTGQVNRVLMAWDDGAGSDAYVVDNIYSSTRSIMKGDAVIAPGLATGFHIEIEYRDAGSSTVSQTNDDGIADGIRIRQNFAWLKGESLGKVSIGQLAPITNSIIFYNLWSVIVHTSPDVLYNTAFTVKNGAGVDTGFTWNRLASALDSPRGDFVRYDTPSLQGFVLSADWGENDVWDVALTFDRTWETMRMSAALAYYRDDETVNARDVRASLLLMHLPTGLYGHAGFNRRDFDAEGREDAGVYYAQLGVAARLSGEGVTTVFGEYGRYENLTAGRGVAAVAGLAAAGTDGAANDYVRETRVDRWGFGVMQTFDAAALEVYGHYNHYDAAVTVGDSGSGAVAENRLEPWSAVILGSRLKF